LDLAETSTSITSLISKQNLSMLRKTQSLNDPSYNLLARLSQSISLEDFTVIKMLGKGKFGRVSLVIHKKTGFACAMKAI
jgi:aurora kinase